MLLVHVIINFFQVYGNWTFGTIVFTVLVFTVTLKVRFLFIQLYLTPFFVMLSGLSLICLFCLLSFIFIMGCHPSLNAYQNMYGIGGLAFV